GTTAEGRPLEAPPAGLDVRLAQPPAVDRNGLLGDLEPEPPQLARDEAGRRTLFGSAGDPEAERVRAERLEPLHDLAEIRRLDRALDGGHARDDLPRGRRRQLGSPGSEVACSA